MDIQSEVRPKTRPESGDPSNAPAVPRHSAAEERPEVSELVDHAKQTATETASEAGNMVRERVDEQYHKLGDRLDDMAKDINQAADSLEGGSRAAGSALHAATRRIERVSSYVERTSTEDVLSDANRYARQHPWTVIVGGMVAGLLASRFLAVAGSGDMAGGETGKRPVGGGSGRSYQARI